MSNENLHRANKEKNDEFYTLYADIEKEVESYFEYDINVFRDKTILCPCDDPEWSNFTKYFINNFNRFGLKKLISSCYAGQPDTQQTSIFDDSQKCAPHGKVLILNRDDYKEGQTEYKWEYLKGDGDFKGAEVTKFRDEADVIVTNPPFSLFRAFMTWITEAGKKFLIIGNQNAIGYKDIFPLIKNDEVWLGHTINGGGRAFKVSSDYQIHTKSYTTDSEGNRYITIVGVCWFTNLDHGCRHKPLKLMTEAENIQSSKHIEIKDKGYQKYDNYDAIEVPYTDAIPSDYNGVMGVPLSFLHKYCPEQFEIIWEAASSTHSSAPKEILKYLCFNPDIDPGGGLGAAVLDGRTVYVRIFIKRRTPQQ